MAPRLSPEASRNRAAWDRRSDDYARAGWDGWLGDEVEWGIWAVPESELGVLGEVAGLDVLELGCGAAHLSCRLAKRGARPLGLDVSSRQLEQARRLQEAHGVEFPLVEASGDDVPLPDASFDVVVSEYGAATWAEPERVVAETARLLRPGGLLAFLGLTPVAELCWAPGAERVGQTLVNDYFGLGGFEDPEDESVTFNLPYGRWIELLRANRLVVEDLVEIRPPEGASSGRFGHVPLEWARRWPAEHVWKARKPVDS